MTRNSEKDDLIHTNIGSQVSKMHIKYLDKLKKSPNLQEIEWRMCKEDPYYFLTNWAKTIDVHDKTGNPIKPFPEKEYIKIICENWLKHRVLLIPKTRQMMISWICVALYLWDTQFHEARFTAFQSKKENDADSLVKRLKHIWDNEPSFLKRYYKSGYTKGYIELEANPSFKGKHVFCKFELPQINSSVIGVPQGGDIIRMHTLSGMFCDEASFQPEMEAAYTALRPTLSNNGRLTIVSTPEDNTWFEQACFDQLEM